MSLTLGTADLARFLAEPNLDPEEIEEFKQVYADLDRFLKARGLPGHVEPETLPPFKSHCKVGSFSYRSLHQLRRARVYQHKDLAFVAAGDDQRDPVLTAEYESPTFTSHLVHFSDCEGFYVPLDFEEPLYANDDEKVLGGAVGSSPRLRAELVTVAPLLAIPLADARLAPEVAAELGDYERQREHPLGGERLIWLALFEAACQSVEFKSAIRLG
ncbi:MAG TPA: hypothetical protein VIQ54_22015 [Polyangia bacterium]